MDFSTILRDWILFLFSNLILGASVMMLFKGGFPNGVKVPPIVSTGLFVVGLTMMLVSGTPDLLQNTIGLWVK